MTLASNISATETVRSTSIRSRLLEKSQHLAHRSSAACADCFRKLVSGIANAKKALLAEFQNQYGASQHLLRLALNEAEALAWQTNYPHLVFPTLAMEKANAVLDWSAHQQDVQQGNLVHSPSL
jgi:hypothetical protein